MKRILCLALGLVLVSLTPVFSQQPALPPPPVRLMMGEPDRPKLTRFDLDFPGGTPRELVAAITKAMGKPLNVIISDEDNSQAALPALKMSDVDVSQLFATLEAASVKRGVRPDPHGGSAYYSTSYGFSVPDGSPTSDNAIWYFHIQRPTQDAPADGKAKVVRFYNLEQFLNRGFSVDDITTAIKTGWKLAGIDPAPELNYHKETKMLIACDEERKLATILQVLDALPQRKITYDQFSALAQSVAQLKDSVADLQKKISDPASKPATTLPQEKSEK
jgi:hypothetical protein